MIKIERSILENLGFNFEAELYSGPKNWTAC